MSRTETGTLFLGDPVENNLPVGKCNGSLNTDSSRGQFALFVWLFGKYSRRVQAFTLVLCITYS